MKLKYPINLHKGLTGLVVLLGMTYFNNFSLEAWVYLALHGSYGILWLLKDRLFPDRQWEQKVSFAYGLFVFGFLGLYWVGPYVLISQALTVPVPLLALAIATNIIGVFLHFTSDAQKYFTLKYRPGLIDEGFFRLNRNPNYLGEMLIYGSFAMTTGHHVSGLILAFVWGGLFLPNMLKKDKSLSRHPSWTAYRKNSWLFLPKPF